MLGKCCITELHPQPEVKSLIEEIWGGTLDLAFNTSPVMLM
jgi:hypothetical protein